MPDKSPDEVQVYRVELVREASVQSEALTESPEQAAQIIHAVIGRTQKEHFVMLGLDACNHVIGVNVVSVGTLTAGLVHPREVFQPAILMGAAGIIVAHNHPSGNTSPSSEDRATTRRLVSAGKLLGIPVLDHLILGESGHFSFREKGLI